MDIFSAPHFHDDDAARKYLEALLWPEANQLGLIDLVVRLGILAT